MTEKDIKKALPGQTLYDRGSPLSVQGLQLRAFDSKKVFYIYYRANRIQRRPKIGDWGILNLEQARAVAKQRIAEATVGLSTAVAKRVLRREPFVDELYDRAIKEHWNDPKFERSGHLREVKANYKKHIKPQFGHLKLSQVTSVKVREWLATFSATPYAGNRSMEVLSRMYRFAEEIELRAQNTNPCKLVRAHSETERKRFAKKDEIAKVGVILEREAPRRPRSVAFLYLLIFTGSRPRFIERAEWKHLATFEYKGKSYGALTLQGKEGVDVVYLPPQAMKVLDTLPRDRDTITGIKMPKDFWNEVRREAGCETLWARDWRRTFATVLMGEGQAMPQISELMNHRSLETTKIYAKLDDDKKVDVATLAGDSLEKLLGNAS